MSEPELGEANGLAEAPTEDMAADPGPTRGEAQASAAELLGIKAAMDLVADRRAELERATKEPRERLLRADAGLKALLRQVLADHGDPAPDGAQIGQLVDQRTGAPTGAVQWEVPKA